MKFWRTFLLFFIWTWPAFIIAAGLAFPTAIFFWSHAPYVAVGLTMLVVKAIRRELPALWWLYALCHYGLLLVLYLVLMLPYVYTSLLVYGSHTLTQSEETWPLALVYALVVWGIWLPTSGRALYRMIVS